MWNWVSGALGALPLVLGSCAGEVDAGDAAGETDGLPENEPEVSAEECAAHGTRETCEAVVPADVEGLARWCYWKQWVPVSLVDGVCELGVPGPGQCVVAGESTEGCAAGHECAAGRLVSWQKTDSGVELAGVDACSAGLYDCQVADGEVVSGPAECLCMCELP